MKVVEGTGESVAWLLVPRVAIRIAIRIAVGALVGNGVYAPGTEIVPKRKVRGCVDI
jgi:hypothetical protein